MRGAAGVWGAALVALACQPEPPAPPVGVPTPHPSVDPSNVVSVDKLDRPAVAKLCGSGKPHCFEGNLFQCDTAGLARSLKQTCRPDSVCQLPVAGGNPSCSSSCPPDVTNAVLAFYDCEACDFTKLDFCAEEGPEQACSEVLCQAGELGFGVGLSKCARDTDGVVVPGSEKSGACEAGNRQIEQQVCVNGQRMPKTRVDVCSP